MISTRNLLMGAFLWTALALDLWMHASLGDDLALVVAALGALGWAALYYTRRSAVVRVLAAVRVVRRP